MSLTRRTFFARMLASATAAAVGTAALEAEDPERLLWEPGKKRIFLPADTPRVVQSAPAGIRLATDQEVHDLAKIPQKAANRGPTRYVMTVQSPDMRLDAHFDDNWNINGLRDATPWAPSGSEKDIRQARIDQFMKEWAPGSRGGRRGMR